MAKNAEKMSREELIKYAARLKSMIVKIQAANAQLTGERDVLRAAVRDYRDAKGRYHTQKACDRLLSLLPERACADSNT